MMLLDLLQARFADEGDLFSIEGRGLYVADPEHAKRILANTDGDYVEHSDFFHTSAGVLGPRDVQQTIGRQAKELLARFVEANDDRLHGLVNARLRPAGRLPDAANHLLYEYFQPALFTAQTPPKLQAALGEVVRHAVLAGARERRSRWQRGRLRERTHRLLGEEIVARRHGPRPAADLLGVVALATAHTHPAEQAGEVFLSLLFATVGSVGFLFGWSLFLWGTNTPPTTSRYRQRFAKRYSCGRWRGCSGGRWHARTG